MHKLTPASEEKFNKRIRRIGRNIRRFRLERGFTQEYMMNLCEMERRYYQRLENGEKNPTFKLLFRVAEVLKIDIRELID